MERKRAVEDRELYDLDYFRDRAYGRDLNRIRMYALERRRIWLYAKAPGRILDIGCGTGDFVVGFDDRWQKFGIEPSEYASRIASAAGVKIFENIEDIAPGSMDVVVLRGSLQHISNPVVVLAEAERVLKRKGLLAILATPDAESPVYKKWGELPALDAPRNWVVFGSKCLVNILKRLGFPEVEVLHPYWSTPYARPLSDLLSYLISLVAGWRPFAWPGNMMEVYGVKH